LKTGRVGFSVALMTSALLGFGCRSQVAGGRPTDGGVDLPPETGPDHQISEPYCPADAAGGGQCPINFCGQLASVASIPSNQFAESGADSICSAGWVCVVGAPVPTGDAFQLTCVDATPGALPFGAACSPNPADGKRCAADALCVESPDFPGSPFCSALCRNDADCPSDASGPGRCIEHQTANLPNGSYARVGMCTPMSKIAGTPCIRESDCAATEGCLFYGSRTNLRLCRAATGTKSLGAACMGSGDCRSGECYDQGFHVYGGQRTYCSGACVVNSDCGAGQTCARLVVGNNGTSDNPLDDVVSGYCQTLYPPAVVCTTDANCVARGDGSDTCDTTYGACYRAAAVPGAACTADAQCMLGGICSTGARFAGGYCQTFGCSPTATTGVDACPGANSVCAQRGGPDEPIAGCYEGCGGTQPCSRAAENYVCSAPKQGTPATICLVGGGT
jgi:hypothetical protein